MAGQSSYLPLSFCLSWSKFGYTVARVQRGKTALAAAPALISRGWQLWDGTLTLLRPSRQPGSRPGVCGCLALLFCPSFYALHFPPPPTTSPCRSKSLIFASAACGWQTGSEREVPTNGYGTADLRRISLMARKASFNFGNLLLFPNPQHFRQGRVRHDPDPKMKIRLGCQLTVQWRGRRRDH